MKYDVSLQTISWFRGRRADNSLEISPKFQRRPVWMEAERSELISTILKKLPFPEIYIQSVLNPTDGTERHVIVDGQQRITSILMYIDNQVSLPHDDYWSGEYFRDLDDTQREAFWNYKVVVRGLSETNDAEIRDLFARLNTNNIALNEQELRNARYKGRFKSAVERFADTPLFQEIGLFSARDIRRMQDVEFASELLLLNLEGITNKKDMLDEAYARYELEFPEEVRFESEFSASINLIKSIITADNVIAIKTRSNFYSLYGACLRYYRTSHRTTFNNTARVADQVGELLISVRTGAIDGREMHAEYQDAVSRAASDRSRRAKREEILVTVISAAEGTPIN
ncbi:DUF262 domain-containing protein [Leptospira interrogans]